MALPTGLPFCEIVTAAPSTALPSAVTTRPLSSPADVSFTSLAFCCLAGFVTGASAAKTIACGTARLSPAMIAAPRAQSMVIRISETPLVGCGAKVRV